jgi:hypothetical protein
VDAFSFVGLSGFDIVCSIMGELLYLNVISVQLGPNYLLARVVVTIATEYRDHVSLVNAVDFCLNFLS